MVERAPWNMAQSLFLTVTAKSLTAAGGLRTPAIVLAHRSALRTTLCLCKCGADESSSLFLRVSTTNKPNERTTPERATAVALSQAFAALSALCIAVHGLGRPGYSCIMCTLLECCRTKGGCGRSHIFQGFAGKTRSTHVAKCSKYCTVLLHDSTVRIL